MSDEVDVVADEQPTVSHEDYLELVSMRQAVLELKAQKSDVLEFVNVAQQYAAQLQQAQHSCAGGCHEDCPGDDGRDGEERLAEAVTVRPGDAVVRLEAGHLGFNCVSGQQWCDRHPQSFRSAGCY